MRRIPCICVILVLLLSTLIGFGANLQPVKAGQFFSDNFNDGNADGWVQHVGSWSATNGEYRVSVGIVENGISTVNGLNLADYTIEAKLRFTDSVGFRAGIVFRFIDTAHYYSFELSNEYDCVDIVKYTPEDPNYGDRTKLAHIESGTYPIQAGAVYQLKVIVSGNSFRCFVNGQEVLNATDNSYTYGEVGLRARRADACFDDFKIENATVAPLPTPTPAPSPVPTPDLSLPSYSDDFSGDSGLWQYLGCAYRDQTNQYLVLTNSKNEHAGVAFFSAPIQGSFTAEFRYKAGDGGYQGDGFTMFFYKQKYPSAINYEDSFGDNGVAGGRLGFNSKSIIPGYGIELDGWQNIPWDFENVTGGQSNPSGDPSDSHIALIQDYVGNHLTYVNDPRVADNEWHNVCVDVQGSSINVYIDNGLVLQWSGELNRTYAGFGFSAGNGQVGSNWHIIDDFSITSEGLNKPTLTTSCATSVSQSSFHVKINGYLTFNGTSISGAPIQLSYSVTGGESWQDLTLVHTGSDGSYSASWLLSVTGDYLLRAVYKGNEDYLGTSNVVNFAIEPCTEQSVFSVDSNSTITGLAFNSTSRELCFGVSGDSGTTGYVEVYIPKSLINDISNLKVYLDNKPIDFTTESQSDCWLLYFTYQHSSHEVTIDLSSSTFLTVEPAVATAIIVTTVIAGTVLVYAAYKLYHKKPISQSELNEKL